MGIHVFFGALFFFFRARVHWFARWTRTRNREINHCALIFWIGKTSVSTAPYSFLCEVVWASQLTLLNGPNFISDKGHRPTLQRTAGRQNLCRTLFQDQKPGRTIRSQWGGGGGGHQICLDIAVDALGTLAFSLFFSFAENWAAKKCGGDDKHFLFSRHTHTPTALFLRRHKAAGVHVCLLESHYDPARTIAEAFFFVSLTVLVIFHHLVVTMMRFRWRGRYFSSWWGSHKIWQVWPYETSVPRWAGRVSRADT